MELIREVRKDNQSTQDVPQAVVVIGANTGGPAALAQILPKLQQDLPASIIIVQQMRPGFTALLAEHLSEISEIYVRHAENNQPLRSNEVVMVPGGFGALVVKHELLNCRAYHLELVSTSASLEMHRTRIDHTMHSAAEAFGARTIGVILTGMGDDGAEGMKAIRDVGGKTIVQDESTSILFDMPRAVIEADAADEVLPLYNIADRINELAGESYASFLQEAAG